MIATLPAWIRSKLNPNGKCRLGQDPVAKFAEQRISDIACHFAQQIVLAIPEAVVTAATEMPGTAESGVRNSVYLVKHPNGHIVVSAGCLVGQGQEDAPTDLAKVAVLSCNVKASSSGGLGMRKNLFGVIQE